MMLSMSSFLENLKSYISEFHTAQTATRVYIGKVNQNPPKFITYTDHRGNYIVWDRQILCSWIAAEPEGRRKREYYGREHSIGETSSTSSMSSCPTYHITPPNAPGAPPAVTLEPWIHTHEKLQIGNNFHMNVDSGVNPDNDEILFIIVNDIAIILDYVDKI